MDKKLFTSLSANLKNSCLVLFCPLVTMTKKAMFAVYFKLYFLYREKKKRKRKRKKKNEWNKAHLCTKYILFTVIHGIGYIVKNYSNSERVNSLLQLYGLMFLIRTKYFIYHLRQHSSYHYHYYTSCGALADMRNKSNRCIRLHR